MAPSGGRGDPPHAAATASDGAAAISDGCPEAIKAEPLQQLGGFVLRHIEEKAVAVRDDKEIEQDLALRGEQPGMDGLPALRLVDIVGDQALQEFARVGATDPEDGARRQEARMALAHIRPFCYQGFRHLWERGRPRKRSRTWPRPSILSSKAEPSSIKPARGLPILACRDGRIAEIGSIGEGLGGRDYRRLWPAHSPRRDRQPSAFPRARARA